MTDLHSQLDFTTDPLGNETPVVDRAQVLRLATRVIELPNDGLLAVLLEDAGPDLPEFHVSFVCLGFYSGHEDGTIDYQVVFHGSGPAGGLRECRHTFWGEADNAGYIFYPNRKLICTALDALQQWFDLD